MGYRLMVKKYWEINLAPGILVWGVNVRFYGYTMIYVSFDLFSSLVIIDFVLFCCLDPSQCEILISCVLCWWWRLSLMVFTVRSDVLSIAFHSCRHTVHAHLPALILQPFPTPMYFKPHGMLYERQASHTHEIHQSCINFVNLFSSTLS